MRETSCWEKLGTTESKKIHYKDDEMGANKVGETPNPPQISLPNGWIW
jgi:hypothetical protein